MKQRFCDEDLSFLRNRVPVTYVIKTLLEMPTCSINGKLSFACPVCGGSDTSINVAHNLARCFGCRLNFNPIDLVMHHRKVGFVDSVRILKKYISDSPPCPSSRNKPTGIGDILKNMMTPLPADTPDTPTESISKRLAALERNVKDLYRLIHKLQSSANSNS